jgi:hypothetical protein
MIFLQAGLKNAKLVAGTGLLIDVEQEVDRSFLCRDMQIAKLQPWL